MHFSLADVSVLWHVQYFGVSIMTQLYLLHAVVSRCPLLGLLTLPHIALTEWLSRGRINNPCQCWTLNVSKAREHEEETVKFGCQLRMNLPPLL